MVFFLEYQHNLIECLTLIRQMNRFLLRGQIIYFFSYNSQACFLMEIRVHLNEFFKDFDLLPPSNELQLW